MLTVCCNSLARPGPNRLLLLQPQLSLCHLSRPSLFCPPLPGGIHWRVLGDWQVQDQLCTRNGGGANSRYLSTLCPEAAAVNTYLICKWTKAKWEMLRILQLENNKKCNIWDLLFNLFGLRNKRDVLAHRTEELSVVSQLPF